MMADRGPETVLEITVLCMHQPLVIAPSMMPRYDVHMQGQTMDMTDMEHMKMMCKI